MTAQECFAQVKKTPTFYNKPFVEKAQDFPAAEGIYHGVLLGFDASLFMS